MSDSDVYRRQNLTSKLNPGTERVESGTFSLTYLMMSELQRLARGYFISFFKDKSPFVITISSIS